jgi:hypothetical protein
MVKHVSIQNFKSIKSLEFEAKRVNVFIGEPNAGKSNILEALGSLTPKTELSELVRYKSSEDIFFDNEISNQAEIRVDDFLSLFTFSVPSVVQHKLRKGEHGSIQLQYQNEWYSEINADSSKNPFRYYLFKDLKNISLREDTYLKPVSGNNLFFLLKINKSLREIVAGLLLSFGYRLSLRTKESEIELVREEKGVFYNYPFQNLSDTVQRVIFYIAAIETNKEAILLFEEPEANTFPYYTKQLAERIAADESNQYFIVTHNPYFLNSLVQQTPIEQLNVFVTYMEDYQTKLRKLSEDDFSKILDLDKEVFYNLDILGQPA